MLSRSTAPRPTCIKAFCCHAVLSTCCDVLLRAWVCCDVLQEQEAVAELVMQSLPDVLQQQGLGQLQVTLQGLSTFRNQVSTNERNAHLSTSAGLCECTRRNELGRAEQAWIHEACHAAAFSATVVICCWLLLWRTAWYTHCSMN